MTDKFWAWLLLTFLATIAGSLLYMAFQKVEPTAGGVSLGNEYRSTSTFYLNSADRLIVSGPGALGSVVITEANTAEMDLFDVTTTNQNLRAATITSSSAWIAHFGASATAGTYVFDSSFYYGLYLDVGGTAATNPTSTLTYRAN